MSKYNLEYVTKRLDGNKQMALEVFRRIVEEYEHPTKAPAASWEQTIRRVQNG